MFGGVLGDDDAFLGLNSYHIKHYQGLQDHAKKKNPFPPGIHLFHGSVKSLAKSPTVHDVLSSRASSAVPVVSVAFTKWPIKDHPPSLAKPK